MTRYRRLRRRTVTAKLTDAERKRRRQAYQCSYYLAHREKAKEYQRQYSLLHKKKQWFPGAKGRNAITGTRPKVRQFKSLDLQSLSPEKIIRNWARLAL